MLASDVNNPAFTGAMNPDDALFVEFYMHEPEDVNKSAEAGRRIRGPSTPYVRIQVPGDKSSVIETPVREEHKARWPQKWLYFQMKEGLIQGEVTIGGWPLEEWDYLQPDQVRELKFMRFAVVEQLAGASDEQCQKIGMGGMTLREAAKRALRDRMGREVKEAIEQKDKEIADIKLRQEQEKEALQRQIDELRSLVQHPQAALSTSQSVAEGAQGPGVTAADLVNINLHKNKVSKKRGRPAGSKNKKPELAVVDGTVSG